MAECTSSLVGPVGVARPAPMRPIRRQGRRGSTVPGNELAATMRNDENGRGTIRILSHVSGREPCGRALQPLSERGTTSVSEGVPMQSELERVALTTAAGEGWDDAVLVDLNDLTKQSPSGPPLFAIDADGALGVEDAKNLASLVGAGRVVYVVTPSSPSPDVSAWLPSEECVIEAPVSQAAEALLSTFDVLSASGREEADRRGWTDAQLISATGLDPEGPVGPPLIVVSEAADLTVEHAQMIAAIGGTGRKILLVTDAEPDPPLMAWIPMDSLHVTEDRPCPAPTPVKRQIDHAMEKTSDGHQIESWRQDGLLHREDGPALIVTGFMGKVDAHEWYRHGALHRDGGPARITYWPSGDIQTTEWHEGGRLHRAGAPAVMNHQRDGTVTSSTWYFDGVEVPPGYEPPPPASPEADPEPSHSSGPEPQHIPRITRSREPPYCSFAQAGSELNVWWPQVLSARDALVADHSWSGEYPNPGTWVGSWWVTSDGIVAPVVTYPVDRDPVDGSAIGPYLSMSTPLGLSVVCPTLDLFSPDSPAQAAFASLVMKWSEQPPLGKVRGLFRSRKQRERPPPLSASECMPLAAGHPPLRRLVQVDSLTVTRHEPSPIAEDVPLADSQAAVWLQYLLPTSDYDVLRRCAGTAVAAMGNVHRVLADPDSTLNGRRDPSEADQLRELMRELLLEPYADVARRAFTHRRQQLKEVAKGLSGDDWNEAEYDALDLVEVSLGPRPPQPNAWPS